MNDAIVLFEVRAVVSMGRIRHDQVKRQVPDLVGGGNGAGGGRILAVNVECSAGHGAANLAVETPMPQAGVAVSRGQLSSSRGEEQAVSGRDRMAAGRI